MKFKTCTKCKKKKALDKFYYRNDIKKYRTDCKECVQKWRKNWVKNNYEHYMQYHKKYRIENREIRLKKQKENYYKNDGAKQRRDWRKKNLKKERETARLYRLNNPEKFKIKNRKKWLVIKNNKKLYSKQKKRLAEYRKTKKYIKAFKKYQKEYFEKNREIINAKNREYYKNNRTQTYLRCYKRRRNLEQQTPKWSNYNKILKIYKKAEQLRKQGKKVNVDHIIPLKNKFVCGLNVPENLKIIEDKLNFRKSNKFIPFLNYKIYGTKKYYEMLQSINYSFRIKSF